MTITVAELLAALAEAESELPPEPGIPPNTYSGQQIRTAMRWGHVVFHRQMTAWLADGTCKRVRVRKEALDGRMCNVTNYQFQVPTKFATAAAPKARKKAA